MRVPDRTGHAGQPIAGQNKTVHKSAGQNRIYRRVGEVQSAVPRTRFTLCSLAYRYNSSLSSAERA